MSRTSIPARRRGSRSALAAAGLLALPLLLVSDRSFAAPPAAGARLSQAVLGRPLAGRQDSGLKAAQQPPALARASGGDAAAPSGARTYATGITWYLMHFVVSIGNDGIMKYLGGTLPPFQIVFLRFLCAAIVLLPVMIPGGAKSFKTERIWMHGVRGALLALGIGLWCRGLSMMPFASCVVINNTMPFFKMIFAMVFLGEKVVKERWLASIGGFIGCLIVFNPTAATFQPQSLVLILSAMCFAMLDIMNKKFAVSESITSMLFYGSVATAAIAAFKAVPNWVPVTGAQLGLFAVLGVGANLLLFCLLKAFAKVDASATCPYRYTEFVLSAVAGFFLFHEKPGASTLLGSCLILPSVIYCAIIETRSASRGE